MLQAQLAGVPATERQAALAVAKLIALALLIPRLNDSSQNYAGTRWSIHASPVSFTAACKYPYS